MAEAFFNHMAEGKARALSAGSQPADKVNPAAAEAMNDVGLDISRNKPKKLTLEIMEGADLAVTMGCADTCPVTTVETVDWEVGDPKDKPVEMVREIRDDIKTRVDDLIKEITEA
jgi:arsenate reductase